MNNEERLYRVRALSPLRKELRIEKIRAQPRKEINEGEVNEALEILKEHIHDLMYLADLTDKESQILLQRFAGDSTKTIREKHQCTRQCIDQIERNALKKMKEIIQDKELERYHTLIDALPYLRIAKTLRGKEKE